MSANSYSVTMWNLKKDLETQMMKKKSVDNLIDIKNPNPILYLIPSINNLHYQKKQVWSSSSTAASKTFPVKGTVSFVSQPSECPWFLSFTTPERQVCLYPPNILPASSPFYLPYTHAGLQMKQRNLGWFSCPFPSMPFKNALYLYTFPLFLSSRPQKSDPLHM